MVFRRGCAALLSLSLLAMCSAASAQRAQTATARDLGPEMTAYMGFISNEEAELTALYKGGEVPVDDYRVSLDRLIVTRQAALRIAISLRVNSQSSWSVSLTLRCIPALLTRTFKFGYVAVVQRTSASRSAGLATSQARV